MARIVPNNPVHFLLPWRSRFSGDSKVRNQDLAPFLTSEFTGLPKVQDTLQCPLPGRGQSKLSDIAERSPVPA